MPGTGARLKSAARRTVRQAEPAPDDAAAARRP